MNPRCSSVTVATVGLTSGPQQVSGDVQRAVVRFWSDLQQLTHQRVDVDAVERLRHEVLLEARSKSPEDHLHVHLPVMEAVIALVHVDDEPLRKNTETKGDFQGGSSLFCSSRCTFIIYYYYSVRLKISDQIQVYGVVLCSFRSEWM